MASNLARRIAFAAVAIPITLGVVWLGGWPLVVLVAVGGVLGVRELYGFAIRQGVFPLTRTGYVSAAVLPALVYLAVGPGGSPTLIGVGYYVGAAWLVAVLALALARRSPEDRPLAAAAITVFGVAYATGLPSFLITLRHHLHGERSWAGAWIVFTPLVVVWVGDTAAMATGKLIGGPRLWPAISPGKTWAGSIGGFLASLLAIPILDAVVLERVGVGLPLGGGLLFAALLAVAAQAGDLAESLFKREVGLKDSSELIPGHGGVLDRFDALYFALPVAAMWYRLVMWR